MVLGIWMVSEPLVRTDPATHAWTNRLVGILVICSALTMCEEIDWRYSRPALSVPDFRLLTRTGAAVG